MDAETSLISLGSAGGGAVVLGLLQWAFKRLMRHEDLSKDSLDKRLTFLEAELPKLRLEHVAGQREVRETFFREVAGLQQMVASARMQGEMDTRSVSDKVSSMSTSVGELKGVLHQLTSTVEQNRDKMSAYYRSEMERLEQRFVRQLEDLQRTLPKKR